MDRQAIVRAYVAQLVQKDGAESARDAIPEPYVGSAAFSESGVTGNYQVPSQIAFDARGLVYSVIGGELVVERLTSTGELEALGRIPVGLGPASIFVNEANNHIVVVGGGSGGKSQMLSAAQGSRGNAFDVVGEKTDVLDIDVSDPEFPGIVKRVTLEGALIGGLRTHDRYRVVTRIDVRPPDYVLGNSTVQALLAEYQYLVTASGNEAWLGAIKDSLFELMMQLLAASEWRSAIPRYITVAEGKPFAASATKTCDSVYARESVGPAGDFIVVTTLDGELNPLRADASFGSRQRVYANANNLFVWSADGDQTLIRRLGLDGDASGFSGTMAIRGGLRADADMEEHDGLLRVVSTAGLDNAAPNAQVLLNTIDLAGGTDAPRVVSTVEVTRDATVSSVLFACDRVVVAVQGNTGTMLVIDTSEARQPVVQTNVASGSLAIHAMKWLDGGQLLALGTTDGDGSSLQFTLFDGARGGPLTELVSGPLSAYGGRSACLDPRNQCGVVYHSASNMVGVPVVEVDDAGSATFIGISLLRVSGSDTAFQVTHVGTENTGTAVVPPEIRFGIIQRGSRVVLVSVSRNGMSATPINPVRAMF